MTYIGGPTALIEFGGVRIVTDPTFDPAGAEYPNGPVVLRKLLDPAIARADLGHVHVVLLSHDQHADNLDLTGREVVAAAEMVLTTPTAAERLHSSCVGLRPWEFIDIPAPEGRILQVTATPAQHGPPEHERGPVTGFVAAFTDDPGNAIYVSGDTVWFEGVAEVARRFPIRVAVLFMGAARVPEVGPGALTMTAEDGVAAARAFSGAVIVPLHYEGWAHFSESPAEIADVFKSRGLGDRLHWLEPARRTPI
jgi:L-ascorbate metabolism protein UlaG (beta-lactamase superfamily)